MSDYSTMDVYIQMFTENITTALEIGSNSVINQYDKEIKNILVTGLGGSGIGGSLAKAFLFDELSIPMEVNKDYFIPNYVNENTLVIISSYSGNTEETIEALNRAKEKMAKIVCLTTQGGKIEKIAKENNYDLIILPSGMPPRACLPISFPQILYVINKLGLISNGFELKLQASIPFLNKLEQVIKTKAKKVSEQLQGKLPVIYAATRIAPVAIRFRQQLNENSKVLGWHHIIPELTHNELVGWANKNQNLAVVFLKNEDDYKRNLRRMEITAEVASKYTDTVIDIWSKGSNLIERSLYLIYLTDWVSFYLAKENEVDAVEVNIINYLKSQLAELK